MEKFVSGGDGTALVVVDDLERVWDSLDELCSALPHDDWNRPTDCPGWTVKDVVSHIVGVEATLLGRPPPDYEAPPAPFVRNQLGRWNEIQVGYRRSWAPRDVLDEFKDVTADRLKVLRSLVAEDLAAESWTPVGPGTVGGLLDLRLLDCWIHEQDIRRAVGRPGHTDDPLVGRVLESLARRLGRAVAKEAGCPDGTAAVFVVRGRQGFTKSVTVAGGRGAVADGRHEDPDVILEMDAETFVCLTAGRCPPGGELEAGRVAVRGDEATGVRIVENLAFML